MIGTDNSDASRHYVICISTNRMRDERSADALVHYVRVNQAVRDIKHITNNATLVALEDSLHVFKMNEQKQIVHGGALFSVHKESIREISVNPFQQTQIASGGDDKILSVWDINKAASSSKSIRHVELPHIVGSVKFGITKQNANLISLTTDNGLFFVVDVRQELKKPVFYLDTEIKGLFSHAFASENNFLLGYGDGKIRSGDIRNAILMAEIDDPLCSCIGDIEYSPISTAFITCGFSSFSVWNHHPAKQLAQIWSHADHGGSHTDPDYKVSARFLSNGKTVVTTDSAGIVAIYRQDFEWGIE